MFYRKNQRKKIKKSLKKIWWVKKMPLYLQPVSETRRLKRKFFEALMREKVEVILIVVQ